MPYPAPRFTTAPLSLYYIFWTKIDRKEKKRTDAEFAESSWSEEFMASLGPKDKEVDLDNSDEDEDNIDVC